MKKHLLLLFGIVSLNCYSQNWKTIKLHKNNFYKCLPSQGGVWNTNAIRIDSAYSSGNDSVFFNFNTIRDTAMFTFPPCVNINGASWLGSHVIEDTAGVNTYFNSNEDSIKIKTLSQINDSWHLYNFTNGDYLEATVSSATIQLVIGNVDSVKQITIQCKDNTGTPIANLFNGKDILISKQYGIIKLYDFYSFPNDTLSFNLSVAHLMTYGEVYDYNVGDEFGYFNNCSTFPPSATFPITTLTTVLEKHFSTALDTVFYHLQVETSTSVFVSLPSPHLEYSYSIDTTVYQNFTNLNQLVCATMPMECGLIDSATSMLPNQNPAQYIMDSGDPNVYCGLESYTFPPGPYFMTTNCPTYYTFEENDWTSRAIQGCGVWIVTRVDQTALPNPIYCTGDLTYIHKGTFVCGTPPLITVGINNLRNEIDISIFPNPFTSQTTISFSQEQNNTTIKISDIIGKEIKTINFTGKQLVIDKAEMKAGIYFVQTTDEKKRIRNNKIIIQ